MDLKSIEEPIIVDDVLHQKDNLKIVKHLLSHGHFQLDRSPIKNKKYNTDADLLLNSTFMDTEQHRGFLCQIKHEQQEINFDEPFSLYSEIIVNQLSKQLKFEYKKITRIMYNYYCREQCATEHQDGTDDNEFSLVYNITTTDGGTIIQGEKYPDKGGQAKIFKSKWWHSSWPCDKDKGRVSLNIKFIV
jgi:hypothetical protein